MKNKIKNKPSTLTLSMRGKEQGSIDLSKNKSADDAEMRITFARWNSLANNPTQEYLLKLKEELENWLVSINNKIQ